MTPPRHFGVQGKTVEVGRAAFETEKKRYTILDAPGHKAYVPNMIGGAAQADVGVLVISARRGEFEAGFDRGGQTREHVMLAKTAGVRRLVVAINKMDDPTVNWDKERYDARPPAHHAAQLFVLRSHGSPLVVVVCSYDEIVGKLVPFLRAAGFPKSGAVSLHKAT